MEISRVNQKNFAFLLNETRMNPIEYPFWGKHEEEEELLLCFKYKWNRKFSNYLTDCFQFEVT